MWKRTGWTYKWTLSCFYSPRALVILCGFCWLIHGEGGWTVAVVTFDTAVYRSREKMADSVTVPGSTLSQRREALLRRTPWSWFSRFFALFILLFIFHSPCISLLRIPFVQQSSTTPASSACFSCVICVLPHLGYPFVYLLSIFRNYYSCPACLLCSRTQYVRTWFADLGSFWDFWFCSYLNCLWTPHLFLPRMKNQDGHWVYCWWRWVEMVA